jgi:hypothetical protein
MTSTNEPRETYVKTAGTLTRWAGSARRSVLWIATTTAAGLTADGPNPTVARERLAAKVDQALTRAALEPAFATDSDGSLIVVVPSVHGGSNTYRIADGQARNTGSGSGDPDEQVARVHHYTEIPRWP